MAKDKSPKETGISDITGKIIRIKHANEYEAVLVEEMLRKHHLKTDGLHYTESVIATENNRPIGCGRLRKIEGGNETACVLVAEEEKERGIESLIVRHLIDYAPYKKIYAVSDNVDIYRKLGFVVQEDRAEFEKSLMRDCSMSTENAVILLYQK